MERDKLQFSGHVLFGHGTSDWNAGDYIRALRDSFEFAAVSKFDLAKSLYNF